MSAVQGGNLKRSRSREWTSQQHVNYCFLDGRCPTAGDCSKKGSLCFYTQAAQTDAAYAAPGILQEFITSSCTPARFSWRQAGSVARRLLHIAELGKGTPAARQPHIGSLGPCPSHPRLSPAALRSRHLRPDTLQGLRAISTTISLSLDLLPAFTETPAPCLCGTRRFAVPRNMHAWLPQRQSLPRHWPAAA